MLTVDTLHRSSLWPAFWMYRRCSESDGFVTVKMKSSGMVCGIVCGEGQPCQMREDGVEVNTVTTLQYIIHARSTPLTLITGAKVSNSTLASSPSPRAFVACAVTLYFVPMTRPLRISVFALPCKQLKNASFCSQFFSRQHGTTFVETSVEPEGRSNLTMTEKEVIACPRSFGVAMVLG